MNNLIAPTPAPLTGDEGSLKTNQLLVVEIIGKARTEIAALVTRFALHNSFFLIAGGEWLPDQDRLRRSVRRYTPAVKETLAHILLARPSTCLQLRDQLAQAHSGHAPLLVLDFLHHFYDPDVDPSLRRRVLDECCQHVRELAQSKPVFILVRYLPLDEYQRFFPLLASLADEILKVDVENTRTEALQDSLF